MKKIETILESLIVDTKIGMLEENEMNPGSITDLDLLRTQKFMQESTSMLRNILTSGAMQQIQESIAIGVQPALEQTDKIICEFDMDEAQATRMMPAAQPVPVAQPAPQARVAPQAPVAQPVRVVPVTQQVQAQQARVAHANLINRLNRR